MELKKMVYIISELCGQWGGDIRRAEQMILESKMAGADAVKVQLWDTYRMPGEDRHKWEYLHIDKKALTRLKDFSENLHIDFFASAFHFDRYEWIKSLGIKTNKFASIVLSEKFKHLSDTMINDSHFERNFISLGMWDKKELPYSHEEGRNIYFHCVPEYPHTYERAIELMPKQFSEERIAGYSDHVDGIEACKEAIRRGARFIEKHYTIDRSLQCKTEAAHACSMNFKELKELRNFCDVIRNEQRDLQLETTFLKDYLKK